jgi:Uri superfamily endonuclease
VYQLHLDLPRAIRRRVGQLGAYGFPRGHYVYTGRAARNLAARVARHIRLWEQRPRFGTRNRDRDGTVHVAKRRLHWHIDYLLSHPATRLVAVVFRSPRPDDECAINRATPGMAIVSGFGAADCRGCAAHLQWSGGGEIRPAPHGARP